MEQECQRSEQRLGGVLSVQVRRLPGLDGGLGERVWADEAEAGVGFGSYEGRAVDSV